MKNNMLLKTIIYILDRLSIIFLIDLKQKFLKVFLMKYTILYHLNFQITSYMVTFY
jgi:hypothetical protein